MSDLIDKLQSMLTSKYLCVNGIFEDHAGIVRVLSAVETCFVLRQRQCWQWEDHQMFEISRRMGLKILCRVCFGYKMHMCLGSAAALLFVILRSYRCCTAPPYFLVYYSFFYCLLLLSNCTFFYTMHCHCSPVSHHTFVPKHAPGTGPELSTYIRRNQLSFWR